MGEMKYRQKILVVPKRDGTDLEDLLDAVQSDNNIKMAIKETGFEGVAYTHFASVRVQLQATLNNEQSTVLHLTSNSPLADKTRLHWHNTKNDILL